MENPVFEIRQGDFLISTDPTRLDLQVIHHFLSEESYWAKGRPLDVVRRSIEHSLCFGLYHHDRQVGFARVITDAATFAWMDDVFILPAYRGQGLSKWLVKTIVEHPQLTNLRKMALVTRDAHELYRKYGGFQSLGNCDLWLERVKKS